MCTCIDIHDAGIRSGQRGCCRKADARVTAGDYMHLAGQIVANRMEMAPMSIGLWRSIR